MALSAVTLDAAGTLFEVAEPVGETYARFARRHGLVLDAGDTECAFRETLAAAPPLAFPGVSPTRRADHERAWWYAVVRRAFGAAAALPDFDACFGALFDHFARPEAWRVFPEVPGALLELRRRGLRLGVVSNFDERLIGLVAGLGLAPLIDVVVPSTRVGAAKPAREVFDAALAALGVPPAAALHVGDSIVADVEGARAAGLRAVLVDRGHRLPSLPADVAIVSTLAELPALVAVTDATR